VKLSANISTLYLVFFLFLTAAFFAGNIKVLYVAEFIVIGVLFFKTSSLQGMLEFLRNYFNLAAIFLGITLIYFSGAEIYTLLFLAKAFLLYQFFAKFYIGDEELLRFLNVTYLLYLIPCLLNYFYTILFSSIDGVNAFHEVIFGFSFVTLYSFEGTTAYIDSYSGLIFLINVFLNNNKTKWNWAFLGLFALLWTTRMTPVVATFSAFAYYYIYTMGLRAVIGIFLFLQFSLIIWLQNQPDVIKFFFSAITHARSLIWTQQFEIFLNNLSVKEFFFSSFDDRYIIQVYSYQRITYNPHNSYLLLLYNSVIGFITLCYLFIKNANTVTDRNWKTIIFSILVAAITNSHVLGLGNPIYIILITYFFYSSGHQKWRGRKFALLNAD